MKKTRPKKIRKPKPELKWQTGAYDRYAKFKFILPYQFLLLCRLMDVTPEQVIRDFTDNLACGSWKREGRDEAKAHLISYFLAHGYGQHHYTEADIRRMFKEMDALGLLFPHNGDSELIDRYARWRDKHHTHWFNQWYYKTKRKLPEEREL